MLPIPLTLNNIPNNNSTFTDNSERQNIAIKEKNNNHTSVSKSNINSNFANVKNKFKFKSFKDDIMSKNHISNFLPNKQNTSINSNTPNPTDSNEKFYVPINEFFKEFNCDKCITFRCLNCRNCSVCKNNYFSNVISKFSYKQLCKLIYDRNSSIELVELAISIFQQNFRLRMQQY